MYQSPAVSSDSRALSFHRQIRQDDNEKTQMESTILDLQLQIKQLHTQLKDEKEQHQEFVRRVSGSPPMENFYEFDEDSENKDLRNGRRVPVRVNTKDDANLIEDLRIKLREIGAERDSLNSEIEYLSANLEQATAELEEEKENSKRLLAKENHQLKTLKAHLEKAMAENVRTRNELSTQQESSQMMKQTMNEVIQSHEEKQKHSEQKADEYEVQLKSAISLLETERKENEEVLVELANAVKTRKRTEKEAKEAKAKLNQDKSVREKLEKKSNFLENQFQKLRAERNAAEETLKAEREKSIIWRKSSEYLRDGLPMFSADDLHLQKLTKMLQERSSQFVGNKAYDKTWREDILDNINFCLLQLYRSIREVEAKREQFIHTFAKKNAVDMPIPDGTQVLLNA